MRGRDEQRDPHRQLKGCLFFPLAVFSKVIAVLRTGNQNGSSSSSTGQMICEWSQATAAAVAAAVSLGADRPSGCPSPRASIAGRGPGASLTGGPALPARCFTEKIKEKFEDGDKDKIEKTVQDTPNFTNGIVPGNMNVCSEAPATRWATEREQARGSG